MKHDDLIARLRERGGAAAGVGNDPLAGDLRAAADALQRVADLHQPRWVDHVPLGRVQACGECSEDRMYALHPCPTLNAIEGDE